jgi:hypothetical protein
MIDQAYLHSKLKIRIGLGFGLTVLEAEQNVRFAFQHARKQQSPVIISVDEDKHVTESIQSGDRVFYKQRAWGSDWEERFKQANISPKIVSKVESLANHYGTYEISSLELSRWMNSTERNARRILLELEGVGMAKVTGEEKLGLRGRPRKLYKLKFGETHG